jgi:superfamily II DNA helicase RecQ
MEAKESLVKIIKSLLEIGQPVSRQILTDYLIGKESREIEELGLYDNETYGIGDAHEEDYWTSIIDKAFECGYLKLKSTKSNNITASKEGKKFAKKPTSFMIDEEEEATDENISRLRDLEDLIVDLPSSETNSMEQKASTKTKQQIKLIHAIDRKIALDDFAESESISFDEVLEELEKLIRQGLNVDITYFTNEVLGEECVEELVDYISSQKKFSMENAIKEYGDVYSEEEIRLAYIVFLIQQSK